MQIEQVALDTLIPYARNAKKHDENQVAAIAASIREFGFNNPVLIDAENGIIAGHGRVLAARKLELATVPCLRLGHLTEAQKRAYILADNRLTEIGGGWDEELLKIEIRDLRDGGEIDPSLAGRSASEIETMLGAWDVESSDKVENTEETLEGIEAKVTVVCPQDSKDAMVAVLQKAVHESGILGARVE